MRTNTQDDKIKINKKKETLKQFELGIFGDKNNEWK